MAREFLDPAELPREYPRRYLPPDLPAGEWSALSPLFEDLQKRPLASRKDLEQALLDLSELLAAVEEEGALRYIRMTCDTTDPAYERAYLEFLEGVVPRVEEALHRLRVRFTHSPAWPNLPSARYEVLKRKWENAVRIFREENIPLKVEEEKLGQRYQKIFGAMTVEFEGRSQTLPQMAKYLEEPDRPLRERAWELIAERRLRDKDEIEGIFEELLSLRERRAKNAGFENFRDYAFRERERFDYGPRECEEFHKGVEESFVPLLRLLHRERAKRLGLKRLRPWDLLVDPEGRPPLRPFAAPEDLVQGAGEIFRRLDPRLGQLFQRMAELGLLDVANRPGKAPGGYQSTLTERRLPFIFMNAVGRDQDLWTLLHEAGHAFHTLLSRDEPLHMYRDPPTEFAEVASMGMELLASPFLDVFYPKEEDRKRSLEEHLYGIVRLVCWVATIDAFQHWLYTHPGHSRAERHKAWVELFRRFGGLEDWSGYEEVLEHEWHRQLHLFLAPFYYIEYGIAQLGALTLWQKSQEDRAQALEGYVRALALGGSKPLPVLFATAGLPFDFGPVPLARAAQALHRALSTA
ncbi:MAG: M3 family oligoendopeptidase [Candidatus Bipolaricaulota bacterium]|nr:M3 family oligoendopeptidase [Candidatus Bipolaricaulota bacterium]